VFSGVKLLDLLESSDSLSGDVASSIAGPSSGSGAEGRVDLRVQLAEVILGEDVDIVAIHNDLGVALGSLSVTVGSTESVHPFVELVEVSSVLLVFKVEGGIGKSLKNFRK